MTRRRTESSGFTAVELLITLFVAAAFLIAGYQLFNLVIKDGGNTRAESAAGNVAYDYLRRYGDSASNPCTASAPVTNQPVTVDGITGAKITIAITCPQSDATTLSKVEATINYGVGADAKTVKYATYVDKSRGATPNPDVTDGLLGRWRLNGNGANDAGSAPNATLSAGIVPMTGQNGTANNAVSLNGTSDTVTVAAGTNAPRPTAAYTLSIWVRPSTVSAAAQRKLMGTTEAGGYSVMIGPSGSYCPSQFGFESYIGGSYRQVCATTTVQANVWTHVVGVYDGSNEYLYLNGVLNNSLAVSGAMTYGPDTVPTCFGSEPNTTVCSTTNIFGGGLDDARIYGKALSASEVLQLYNGGAK